ncbi:hypothetical protein HPB50_019619 [Hyalomma asiaticum]|uniref:Uncharacterized protein n=1 Tax=Hyalomma asiaticum TaxID=266040 RepID=A0ACB7RS08_HYAAI|nr:hypothetical protein HPB50_019619 [Hyalomma asiaticum]
MPPRRVGSFAAGPPHPDWCRTGDGDAADGDPLTTFNEITNHYKLGRRTAPHSAQRTFQRPGDSPTPNPNRHFSVASQYGQLHGNFSSVLSL